MVMYGHVVLSAEFFVDVNRDGNRDVLTPKVINKSQNARVIIYYYSYKTNPKIKSLIFNIKFYLN